MRVINVSGGRKAIHHCKMYALYNDVTDDTYIGVTCGALNKRLNEQRYDLKRIGSKLYVKMKEIGFDIFKIVELLSSNTDWTDAHKTECEFIEFFKPTLNSYVTGKYVTHNGSFDEKAYRRVYYVDHRERELELSKERYIKNRCEMLEKVVCECGATIVRRSVNRHLKTKKHRELLNKM